MTSVAANWSLLGCKAGLLAWKSPGERESSVAVKQIQNAWAFSDEEHGEI